MLVEVKCSLLTDNPQGNFIPLEELESKLINDKKIYFLVNNGPVQVEVYYIHSLYHPGIDGSYITLWVKGNITLHDVLTTLNGKYQLIISEIT